ncbi:MAG: carboxyl transferase domain-containing protein [Myxococcota bacterium]
MPITRLLIANRGEIAVRIARAAADLGIAAVAVYSEDDAASLHTRAADEARALDGRGVAAYLDLGQVVATATEAGCDAVHPGYGFLAENAAFARSCAAAGIIFVGANPDLLALFGDKGRARAAAAAADVPILKGSNGPTTLEEAEAFFQSLGDGGAMMIKALAGGGGRGTRSVTEAEAIAETFERCRSEAQGAFGSGDLYVEQLIRRARHIEVQVLGDTHGSVVHLGERECSAQRRHQKIVEMAPAPNLSAALRDQLAEAAVRLASSVRYDNLGTFEFLIDEDGSFVFIEANARLQVEHTVTEEVTGIDLVQTQLHLAAGAKLADLGLDGTPIAPRGFAVQARVNIETITADGDVRPSGGKITAYEAPSGPGVRTDGFGYTGYTTSPSFDSLLAKVIGHSASPNFMDAVNRTYRALGEFRIEGVATNIPFLQSLLRHPDFGQGAIYTRWVDDHVGELTGDTAHRRRFLESPPAADAASFAGAQIDTRDPLALFAHDRSVKESQAAAIVPEAAADLRGPDGSIGVAAPIQGTIISVDVQEGDVVHTGAQLIIMEAMKMEHVIKADRDGIVRRVMVEPGHVIAAGHALVYIEEADVGVADAGEVETIDADYIRPDLEESHARHAYRLDANRPEAVAHRRRTGQRTARENIYDLCDEGSFVEYGPLVVAAQRRRRTEEWLRKNSPGDGLVMGVGRVNGHLFDDRAARCIAISYDYTVFAGTQGHKNHYKQDRIFELANRYRLPIIFFTEGGGGRPGDTDGAGGIGMDVYTFTQWSKLSGWVPMVGISSGRCFAGNTALLGCCDVIIATENSTIAMGGPAMIEGGGLGVFTPEEVGPMSFQVPNGVVDILVKDEAAATRTAQKYISYFQGRIDEWEAPDQRPMRHIVPENRLRMYDVREVIETLADKDSILEIRRDFGIGIITAFIRIDGHPLGLIANNPYHLAGAIDSDGADKGARFLQLCDAFDIPIVSLMDCPGMMVGPEVEKTALVRHCCRLFNTGANLSVPMFGVILRKAYGLGVQAMCGGSSLVPFFTAAWPTAEFAGMNIEGAVKLGYRRELEAIEDPEERLAKYTEMVAASYERAKAVNSASFYGVDDVIDPADTRDWIVAGIRSLPEPEPRTSKKRPYIDTW